MSNNKSTLIKESVIRRWGKLANMAPITENWLDTISEEEDEEAVEAPMDAMDAEVAAPEAEMGDEEEVPPAEAAAVERIVSAVVDAISTETGVDIEVEGEAGMEADAEMPAELGAEEEEEMEMADDEEPAMRDGVYNKKDIDDLDKSKTDTKDKEGAGVDETLNIDVIDDENLTEAVLKRVVERLLRNRRK